jgi:hypothetical protein
VKDRPCHNQAVCRCFTMPQIYPAGLAPTSLQQNLMDRLLAAGTESMVSGLFTGRCSNIF